MEFNVLIDAVEDCEPPDIAVALPKRVLSAYASSESSCCSDSDSASTPGQACAAGAQPRDSQQQVSVEAASRLTDESDAGREFRCSLCNACFSRPQNLRSHIRRKHVGRENVVCQICGKVLSSNSALKKHMMLHSDENPFGCNLCKAAFKQKCELEKHIDSNHGSRELENHPKPYQCPVCQRRFVYHSSMTAHRRCHRKTLMCDLCDRCFLSATDLKRHRLAIHQPPEDRPFVCDLCHERFSRKEHRDYHLAAHAKAVQRSCPVCGLFGSAVSLRAHLASAHASPADDADLRRRLLSGVDNDLLTNQEMPDLSLLDALLLSPDLVC